jgi:hypothetical protein
MSTMIERVARAILAESLQIGNTNGDFDALPAEAQNVFTSFARAAIEAMREPTDKQLKATEAVVVGYDDFACGDGTLFLSIAGVHGREGFYDHAKTAWHAMIDAALKEETA